MTPLGCEGGGQNTTAVVSDVPTTAAISTTPGAVEKTISTQQFQLVDQVIPTGFT